MEIPNPSQQALERRGATVHARGPDDLGSEEVASRERERTPVHCPGRSAAAADSWRVSAVISAYLIRHLSGGPLTAREALPSRVPKSTVWSYSRSCQFPLISRFGGKSCVVNCPSHGEVIQAM